MERDEKIPLNKPDNLDFIVRVCLPALWNAKPIPLGWLILLLEVEKNLLKKETRDGDMD